MFGLQGRFEFLLRLLAALPQALYVLPCHHGLRDVGPYHRCCEQVWGSPGYVSLAKP